MTLCRPVDLPFEPPGPDAAVFVISVAAELGLPPQRCAPTSGWA